MRHAEHLILLGGISSASGSTGTAPTNIVAPNVTGSPTVGSVLTTDNGTWIGTAPITYTYQWRNNGSNISLATSSTYTLVSGDNGAFVDCLVTATNAIGNASQASNSVGPVTTPGANDLLADTGSPILADTGSSILVS